MADLNAIAHGVNSETGEYLTPQERKALFKKGKMKSNINVGAFRSGVAGDKKSGDGGVGGGIVRMTTPPVQDTSAIVPSEKGTVEKKESEPKRDYTKIREKFIEVESVFKKLVTVKSEKKRLHEKYLDSVQPTPKAKTAKKQSGPMPMGKTINRGISKASFNVFGMLGDLLQYYVLSWIGDPKNKKIVETFTTIFKHVASFFNWFITGVIDNLLTGFAELVGGDSILERIGGFFKLLFGFIGLRWLLNPFKIIKDLGRVFKFGKKFVKIFKGIFKLGDGALKKSFGAVLKLAGKAFRVTLGRMIKRVLISVFGKALTKGLIAVTKTAVKGITKIVGKIPIVGPLIAFGVNLAMGEPVGRAAFKAIGATILGAIGTGFGGPLGAIIGGLAGDWAGGKLYDIFFGGKDEEKKEEKKEDAPELASGGVVSGPEKGFLAVLHGTEAVIPVAKIPEILTLPFKVLGSKILGAIFAVIDAMGSVGRFVKPIAVSVLAPAMKAFGMEKAIADRDIGKTQGNADSIKNKINNEREKQDLDKMFGKDVFKEIGEMLLIGGGSIFGSLFGGAAQASQSDPTSSFSSRGDGKDSSVTGGDFSGKKTPKNTSSAAGQWKPLLEMIAAYESVGGSYDSIYPGSTKPGLSQMTIAEADAWQASTASQRGSAAAGRYQFMNIKKQAAAAGIGPDELFSPENQDKMAIALIEGKRGVTLDMIKNNPDEAMIRLGMEWAALPMPKNMQGHRGMVSAGQSYYAGDGKNAAHVSIGEVKSVFAAMGSAPAATAQQSSPTPGVTPTPLTPEQKSTMFQKAGMPALSADTLTSAAPSTPAAQITPSTPSSASMPALSSSFSITQTLQSRQTNNQSIIATIKRGDNYNVMNATSMNLNKTSGLSETLVLNRI